MNRLFSILIGIIVLALSGCTASKTVVSKNADLAKYKYATILNTEAYRIPAELVQYEIQLFDAVESSGLQLISGWRIAELTPEQKSELLLVKYGVSKEHNTTVETIVTVNFIDYMSGRPIASCQGVCALGITEAGDLEGAIMEVAKQISATFPK